MSLHIGDVAPDFTAETTEGTIHFHDWIGDGWAILFSHPKDFTPVCTTELGYMAKLVPEFEKRHCKVIGLSVDSVADHQRWMKDIEETQGHAVNYPMIGDPTGTITRNFGVMIEEEGLALRGTFVINPEGQIKVIETHDLGIGRDAKELLRKVQAAQYIAAHPGEVCPAKWTPGDATLAPSLDLVGKI